MRHSIQTAAVIAALVTPPIMALASDAPPQARIDKARAALGGAAKLSAVTSLQLKGQQRTRFNVMSRGVRSADYRTEGKEIRMLFPDHYLVISDGRFGGSHEGFAGAKVIGEGLVGRWRNPETFGYLALALLLRSDSVFPFAAKSEADGALTFVDPNDVTVTVDLDPKTSRPIRLRYDAPLRGNNGKPRGGTIATRIELSDFRQTGGLMLPHTIAKYQGADLITEHTFTSIVVNPPLTKADFK